MPLSAIANAGSPNKLAPSDTIVPEVGLRKPVMLLSSVLLPAPLRPTQATTWLRCTVIFTSNSAFDLP